MRSTNDFRPQQSDNQDFVKKSVKLEPIRKSGKERHSLYKGLSNPEDEEDDYSLSSLRKRESVLDYMDDESDEELDEEEEWDDDLSEEEEYDDQDLDDEDEDN